MKSQAPFGVRMHTRPYQNLFEGLPASNNVRPKMMTKTNSSSCLMGKLVPEVIALRPDLVVMKHGPLSNISPDSASLIGSYL